MFDPYVDWYRVGMSVAYLFCDAYFLGLNWFGWRRTRLTFFRFLVAIDVIYVLFSLIHTAIACNEEAFQADILGFHAYAIFAHTMYILRPLVSLVSLIASTMMVRWIVRSHSQAATTTNV